MQSFEEFREFFNTEITEAISGLEERRAAMHKNRLRIGLSTVMAIFVHWVLTYLNIVPFFTIYFSLILIPLIGFFVYQKKFQDLSIPDDYKETVVKKTIEFIDPSLSYASTDHITTEEFYASELFLLRPDDFTGDDLIEGEIDGIPIRMSELQVKYFVYEKPFWQKQPSKKWKHLFGGIFLVAQYPKNLNTRIFILPSSLYRTMGYVGMLVQKNNLIRGDYIRPKNRQFRREFVVYADDAFLGEQLLTAELMEKLLLLKKQSQAAVYASIIGNKINVAIDLNREIFKVDITKPLYNANFVRSFYNEIFYIFGIIDDLNIDEMILPSEESAAAGQPEEEPLPGDMGDEEELN